MKRFAFAALALLAACGARAERYPAEYATGFQTACEARNPPAGYCDCVWGKIEREIPVNDFISFDSAARAGQPHPLAARVDRFAAQCIADPHS